MVEQRRKDLAEELEVLNQAAEKSQRNFTGSLGRLLVAEGDEEARQAIFEAMYFMAINACHQTRSDLLKGIRSSDEIQSDIDAFNAVAGMLLSPVKDWQTFKFAIDSLGKTFYEELTEGNDEFDLSGDFGLPQDFGVMGIPVLRSTEFVDVTRQKELFGERLLSKLNLVPNEKSLWEHQRAEDFTFDFKLP